MLQSAIASHGLVARSLPMMRIVHLVESLHRSDATVFITGESGTGKEVIARALHAQSTHGAGPFVPVNCAALPGELLESELFGHVRGAFTGAVKDRVGRLEMAFGGTLFLDEAAEIPPGVQVKLLRDPGAARRGRARGGGRGGAANPEGPRAKHVEPFEDGARARDEPQHALAQDAGSADRACRRLTGR